MTIWTPLLLKVLLIALPLSLTGWLVTRLLRQGPALRRRGLITLVMSALLLLPLLVWFGPRLLEVTLPQPEPQAPIYINFSQSLVVSAVTTAPPAMTWLDWALLTWIGGALLGLFILIWGLLGVQRHIRRSTPLSAAQIEGLGRSLPGGPGGLPLDRIRLTDHLQGPAAAGFFKSRILIPTRLFDHLEAAELQALVLHEWAHINNRDSLFTLLGRLASLFYWWNPLVHLLSRERERIQELIGDQAAARRSGELDYAKALLSLAEKSCHDQTLRGVLAFFGPLPLKERIERILFREENMNKRKWQKGVLFAGSLAMAVMLAAAGTEFVRENTVKEPEPEPVLTIASGEPTAARVDEPQADEKPQRLSADKQPKVLKRVEPAYPEEAKKNRVTSQVLLAATTNEKGEVAKVDVISGHPLFNDAAVKALKQWLYEPYLVDGKPKPVQFTVIMTFKLGDRNEQAPLKVDKLKQPVLIKRVEPEYPQAALDARVQGQVLIEATTDIYGRVAKAVHIAGDKTPKEPEYPLLVDAALEAVKQWVYEPYIIDGKPKAVTFTVIMTFKLDKDKKESPTEEKMKETPPPPKTETPREEIPVPVETTPQPIISSEPSAPAPPPIATGDVRMPKLIKRVDPNYPIKAVDARVQGVVAVEATTDEKGRVKKTKAVPSKGYHPPEYRLLIRAAQDAVKQWVYEPYMVDGEPKPLTFTVELSFRLGDEAQGLASRQESGSLPDGQTESADIQASSAEGYIPPRLIRKIPPEYPEVALRGRVSGQVILQLTVNDQGLVEKSSVLYGHPLLNNAAREAVSGWRYHPATINQKPVPSTIEEVLTFKLSLQ